VSSLRYDDPLMQALATLPAVLPDETRADQVRVQCRALMERPQRQLPGILEPATVGALCAMYAWQIVRIVVR